ncbi:MAG TPA: SET domain-containing protein-lysine N-methyltransferase [Tepidisphaeraceae bacterium]|nr:SET domain-containing protein-lysine N-methyltransferase [Tepidisphaeraceae bacterium]
MCVYVGKCDLGKGVFAARPIAAGEMLFAIGGIIIDFATVHARGERECYPVQIATDQYIDVVEPGSYLNHSCDPNVGIRLGNIVVALRDIQRDEEIRFDYSTTMGENCWTMNCRCGSKRCRGIITDFELLAPEVRQEYITLGIVQPFLLATSDPLKFRING